VVSEVVCYLVQSVHHASPLSRDYSLASLLLIPLLCIHSGGVHLSITACTFGVCHPARVSVIGDMLAQHE
jgi:hypothetical protein